jgi:tellurite resistance protein TerC
VLLWGIVGALVMRAALILAGAALIQRFGWILYLFGAFLIVSGVKMALARHAPKPENNLLIALARRLLPTLTISPESRSSYASTANWPSRRLRLP